MQPNELLDLQNDLLTALAMGNGLEELTAKLGRFLGCPVILTNPSYRIISYASFEEDLVLNHIRVSSADSPNSTFFKKISYTEDLEDYGFVFPIKSSHETIGFLILIHATEQDEIIRIAKSVINILAIELLKRDQMLSIERQYKDHFLFDLLYGNMESDSDIINRGKIWGWRLDIPQGVVVFELEDYEQYSSDSQLAMTLLDIIETELIQLNRPTIVFRKKGELAVILSFEEKKIQKRIAQVNIFGKKVLSLAEEKLGDRIIRVGCGRAYPKPSDIFRSYQEAKVALELGRMMNIRSKIPTFRDLGLPRILYKHDLQDLVEFYNDTLGELLRYDSEQNTDFVKTLEKYLLSNSDLKAAADDLFLHPNTLRYRLKKIEEVLELDLNDNDVKSDLMAAFKIKYIKNL